MDKEQTKSLVVMTGFGYRMHSLIDKNEYIKAYNFKKLVLIHKKI